jgi:hypothetical protein
MADAETDAKPVDQDALVADIEQTRVQLARTIDAIADRVNPQKNLGRALEQVRQRAGQVDPLMAGAGRGRPRQRYRAIPRPPPQALAEIP